MIVCVYGGVMNLLEVNYLSYWSKHWIIVAFIISCAALGLGPIATAHAETDPPRFNGESLCDFITSAQTIGKHHPYNEVLGLAKDLAHLVEMRRAFANPVHTEKTLAKLNAGDLLIHFTIFFPSSTLNPCDDKIAINFYEPEFRKLGGVLHGLTLAEVRQLTAREREHLRTQANSRQKNILLNLNGKECPARNIPEKAQIIPLRGTSIGGVDPEFHFPKEPRQTTRLDVLLRKHPYPVILHLMGIAPHIWNLEIEEGVELAAVFVSGTDPQAVANIPKGVPTEFMVQRFGFRDSCQTFWDELSKASFNRVGSPTSVRSWTVQKLKEIPILINRNKDTPPKPHRFMVSPDDTKVEPEASWSPPPLNRNDILAVGTLASLEEAPPVRGQTAGFNVLLDQGKVRMATQDDIRAWEHKAAEPYKMLAPTYKPHHGMVPERTFVALKALKIPTVMSFHNPKGGTASMGLSLLIPEGVPIPDDSGSSNAYYFLKDGEIR